MIHIILYQPDCPLNRASPIKRVCHNPHAGQAAWGLQFKVHIPQKVLLLTFWCVTLCRLLRHPRVEMGGDILARHPTITYQE